MATDLAVQAISHASAFIEKKADDFAAVLPSHLSPQTFIRLSIGVMRKNADLAIVAQKNPASLWHALMECSRLGHEPGTDQFALVPFKSKDAPNGVEVVGIEQYQGKIERMYRASIPGEFGVQSIHCDVVRENDLYIPAAETEDRRPLHKKGWFLSATGSEPPGELRHGMFTDEEARGPMVGVYAYAELAGGAISRVVEMPKSEVMKHKAAAKTEKFWTGTWEKSMWLKTAIHQLETWVPTSAEYRRRAAIQAAAMPSPPRFDAAPHDDDELPPIRVEAKVE